MSIEASLPMLLAVFGVSCSVFGVNTLVMGRLCRSKGIELVNRLIAHKPEIEQLHAKLGAVETKERKQ